MSRSERASPGRALEATPAWEAATVRGGDRSADSTRRRRARIFATCSRGIATVAKELGMRLIQYSAGWLPLDSAPLDEDVTLLVTDGASEPYPVKFPSKLTAAGWVSSAKGMPLAVTPVKWKPYSPPRSFKKK